MAHRFSSLTVRVAGKPGLSCSCRLFSSHFHPVESEYVDEPCYPPIVDLSRQARKNRAADAVAQSVTDLPTVEEKLIQLNEPKYYGFWSLKLSERLIGHNLLPFIQFATRTTLSRDLPKVSEQAAALAPALSDKVQQAIVQEFELSALQCGKGNKSLAAKGIRTKNLNQHLNCLLITSLQTENEDLADVEIDEAPRIEAGWFLGGIEPDRLIRKSREGQKLAEEYVEEPITRPIQYSGQPCLSLRHRNPLGQLVDRQSGLSTEGPVPQWSHDPRVLGFKYKKSRITCVPGFWPGVERQYGYLSILNRSGLNEEDPDKANKLDARAVLHSFAWTLGQACYLGFGPYTELTYPLSTQTVVSDGQHFSFYAYQLNTCALYQRFSGDANPLRNVCLATDELKLFDVVENGQVKGFNDEVLKRLIQVYLTKTTEPVAEPTPYLSAERFNANLSDDKRRSQIEGNFKHLYSNRPRHLPEPEIFAWEKIYKIDHKTRPIDAKRRFFETGDGHPGQRRLHDHAPPYVPRNLRDPPKKSRRGRLPQAVTIKL